MIRCWMSQSPAGKAHPESNTPAPSVTMTWALGGEPAERLPNESSYWMMYCRGAEALLSVVAASTSGAVSGQGKPSRYTCGSHTSSVTMRTGYGRPL